MGKNMPFPRPRRSPIADTLEDYLLPKKSAIHAIEASDDLQIKGIAKGDALTIELGRHPHHGCVGLIDYEGDTFLAVLHWQRGRRYAQTDDRRCAVTEEMVLVGVARALIKDHLQ
ncbi:hypothetical protein L4D76_26215 [Photobacterium sagamiensis]|uniref:hypothetical protein n=1 Tax=Photobacterium sagamiensis TaxID=2910241 RepID=UPI003D0B3804